MEAGEGIDHALARPAGGRATNIPRRAQARVTDWWPSPARQAVSAALIATLSGLALAIGLALVAVALAHRGSGGPPPLLLSAVWSLAAGISFVSSIGYLLIEPKRHVLLRVSAIPAAAMFCAVLLLLLRNG
ncbi:MAG: hypothetical protein ACRDMH_15840 [Solirubrobacterales bacterium]